MSSSPHRTPLKDGSREQGGWQYGPATVFTRSIVGSCAIWTTENTSCWWPGCRRSEQSARWPGAKGEHTTSTTSTPRKWYCLLRWPTRLFPRQDTAIVSLLSPAVMKRPGGSGVREGHLGRRPSESFSRAFRSPYQCGAQGVALGSGIFTMAISRSRKSRAQLLFGHCFGLTCGKWGSPCQFFRGDPSNISWNIHLSSRLVVGVALLLFLPQWRLRALFLQAQGAPGDESPRFELAGEPPWKHHS